jgi:hypothetical protein
MEEGMMHFLKFWIAVISFALVVAGCSGQEDRSAEAGE